MHELSIATAIADVARRHARGNRVTRVEVKVGHLRQVVPRALAFSWDLVVKDTILEGSELALEEVPARGRCRACGETGPLPSFPISCSTCGSFEVEIVAGEELQVEALELDDEPESNREGNGTAASARGRPSRSCTPRPSGSTDRRRAFERPSWP